MDIGARPDVCVEFFFYVLIFCLNSRRWFVLCMACISYLVLVQVSGDRD
jgi:hypothetical protein